MAEVIVEGLAKRFAARGRNTTALADVAFNVPPGDMLVLLGPSGCGKTTTLRCIAGLETPDDGRVLLGDTVVFDKAARVNVPTHRRDIGLVFQTFALWPHLSARKNIEFPLTARRARAADRPAAIDEVARLVHLDQALLDRRPGQLSGGQQQRVGLARALVASPGVVLFDEPLGSLDAHLREQLRNELRSLHRRVGFTGIYVTHDFTEALALGDQVAVMRAGRIEQMGKPEDVFDHPATTEVATLLGLRPFTVLHRGSDGWYANSTAQSATPLQVAAETGDRIDVFARPEHITIERGDGPLTPSTDALCLQATVTEVTPLGTQSEVDVRAGEHDIRVLTPARGDWSVGERVTVRLPVTSARLYRSDGRACSLTEPAAL